MRRDDGHGIGHLRIRRASVIALTVGAASMFGVQAGADVATLTPGPAYCY
jgi:hypothetical protein